jgi:hypothetical protein
LLPHRIVEERTDEGSICSTLLDKYPEDFSTVSLDTFKAELQMRKRFWEEKSQEERPHSFIESLNFCGAHFFQSVFTAIKIVACIPVTVVLVAVAIVLHIDEAKNLPEEYNWRRAPQRACSNERS